MHACQPVIYTGCVHRLFGGRCLYSSEGGHRDADDPISSPGHRYLIPNNHESHFHDFFLSGTKRHLIAFRADFFGSIGSVIRLIKSTAFYRNMVDFNRSLVFQGYDITNILRFASLRSSLVLFTYIIGRLFFLHRYAKIRVFKCLIRQQFSNFPLLGRAERAERPVGILRSAPDLHDAGFRRIGLNLIVSIRCTERDASDRQQN